MNSTCNLLLSLSLIWGPLSFASPALSEATNLSLPQEKTGSHLVKPIAETSQPLAQNAYYDGRSFQSHSAAQKSFAVNGGSLKYLDLGQGQPILLLHGVPTSSWMYRKLIAQLDLNKYRVIAPDLLGWGNSSKVNESQRDLLNPDRQATRILQLMDHLEIPQWVNLSHDASGMWSWEILTQAPERIQKLIILNSVAFEDGFKPPVQYAKTGFSASMSRFVNGLLGSELIGDLSTRIAISDGLNPAYALSDNALEGYAIPLRDGAALSTHIFFTNFEDTYSRFKQYTKILQATHVDSLIIWGQQDTILLADKQIPQLQAALGTDPDNIHVLSDAKHYIAEEKAEILAKLITSYLETP